MPTKSPKIFISHAHENKPLVRRLEQELQAAGAEVWVDHSGVRLGENLPENISKALAACDLFLLIWSDAASASHWVKLEWTSALALQKIIIPCCLDETTLPALLASLLYIDFGNEELGISKLRRDIELAQQSTSAAPGEPTGELVRMLWHKWAAALTPIWNVPHHRNPHFTGRKQLLHDLRNALTAEKAAALKQAIHGLGGVGKTQLVVEYAYRHANDYDLIWWLRAEDTSTLAADFASLAAPLKLPEKDTADQNVVIAAVRNWLNQHTGWLLIFDNASSVEELRRFLPQAATGHTLITSCLRQWHGLANTFGIKEWEPQEAIDFFCRRTGQTDTATAQALAEGLGYLPLALAQGAAYITAAEISLRDYLQRFQQHHQEILNRGKPENDYPHTVETTWELSFQQAIKQSPAAAELLNVCAFLAPDNIPRDLLYKGLQAVTKGSGFPLGEQVVFDEAVIALRSVSLLEATPETLSVHRLVQAVARDLLSHEEKKLWTEIVVEVVCEIFPYDSDDERSWPVCTQLATHALTVARFANKDQVAWDKLSLLLNQVGLYFHARANYDETESLYRNALAIREKKLGFEHPHVATSLNNLAGLLETKGKFAEAEQLYQRALKIFEKQLGTEHIEVANTLNNLAVLFQNQEQYTKAEPFLRRAMSIFEKQLGTDHLLFAMSLRNMAELLRTQGLFMEAESLSRQALTIFEDELGPEHSEVALSLNNLGELFMEQGKYSEAESSFIRSKEICEKQLGTEHPYFAIILNNLAGVFRVRREYLKAELLYRQALKSKEKLYGVDHPKIELGLNNLAEILQIQNKYAEAESIYCRLLEIGEKRLGPEHPEVATTLDKLAVLLWAQGRYTEAETFSRRTLQIREKQQGQQHPDVATTLNNMAALLLSQKKFTEAELLYRRSLAICDTTLGPEHHQTQMVRKNLKSLLAQRQSPKPSP